MIHDISRQGTTLTRLSLVLGALTSEGAAWAMPPHGAMHGMQIVVTIPAVTTAAQLRYLVNEPDSVLIAHNDTLSMVSS